MTDSKSSCRFFAFHNEVALMRNKRTAIKPKPIESLVPIFRLLIFIVTLSSNNGMHCKTLHYWKLTWGTATNPSIQEGFSAIFVRLATFSSGFVKSVIVAHRHSPGVTLGFFAGRHFSGRITCNHVCGKPLERVMNFPHQPVPVRRQAT
ncbi:hypothetical protein ACFO3A_15150 [Comamonas nitrativorans]|uniref:Uncharacterized protein n=1 Tax=Comamonas nitrativorans TaxID=108437 RepID=A0ABV9GZ94_9BURK